MYTRWGKRLADLTVSVVVLLVLWPVLSLIALAVRVTSRGPALYRGLRVGRNGRTFRMLKFRSMVVDAERIGGASTAGGDPRVTPLGHLLRRYKLDELPQFLNVLRGEMSLVGPRPEVPQYAEGGGGADSAALSVRPGITDWASIWNSDEGAVLAGYENPDKAFEDLVLPTKLALRSKYAQEVSPVTDVRILVCTAYKLLRPAWLPGALRPYGNLRARTRVSP